MPNIYYQLVVILYNTTMHMHRVRARMQIMHTHVLLLSNTSQQSILQKSNMLSFIYIYIIILIILLVKYHQYYHTRKKYAQQYSMNTLVCIICIIICILSRVQTMHSTTTNRVLCIVCTQYDVLHHIDRSTWEHSVDKSEF